MHGKRDAKNNPRDYGIARRITGSKNSVGDPLWNVPLTSFRIATNGGISKCRVTGQHDRRVKFLAGQVAILAEHYFEPCNG